MNDVQPADPLETALRWTRDGHRVAIATVLETWGSAPRPAGSRLAVREDGAFEGSVSGGCIEGAVISEAGDVLASGEAKCLEFGVSQARAWEVGLACGGRILIRLEPLSEG